MVCIAEQGERVVKKTDRLLLLCLRSSQTSYYGDSVKLAVQHSSGEDVKEINDFLYALLLLCFNRGCVGDTVPKNAA